MEILKTMTAASRLWIELYRGSDLLQFGLHAAHLGALAVALVAALGADARALRARRWSTSRQRAFAAEFPGLHLRITLCLAVVFASGIMLLLAKPQALLGSPVFWLKMTSVALLLWNGDRLRQMIRRLRSIPAVAAEDWARFEEVARYSAGLWVITVALGLLVTIAT